MQNSMHNNKKIFPCKSINLLRFIKQNGIEPVYKHTDIIDKKDCWLFIYNENLCNVLTQWRKNKK